VWDGKRISVIFPTYNEKESIRAAIEEFFATGVVDEIVVVNNNAAPGTHEEVAKTAAREVFEPRQGYGAAIQRGLREATGDYLILAEPDGTFEGRDVLKLLAYAEDFQVVFGTRTTSSLIGQGANMGLFLKWGNWAVAKLLEFLFDTTHFSDVGCTMRLIHRDALAKISDGFTVAGSHFGVEMMLLVVSRGLTYIEIPVHYRARVGQSSVTGDPVKAVGLGLRMILFILAYRLRLARPPSPRLAALTPVILLIVLALALEGVRWIGGLVRSLNQRTSTERGASRRV
jgi:glycosyltransferase involved in cell wall biosynthesis